MRLSTQKKKDLKENVANAKIVYRPTKEEVTQAAKERKKNRVYYDLSVINEKPVNRKKNRDSRRPRNRWLNIPKNPAIIRSHMKKPQYRGMPITKAG